MTEYFNNYNNERKDVIYCRNNGEYSNDNHHAHGAGYYEQKAYNPIIKIVCEANGVTLRTVKAADTKVEILVDNILYNRYASVKIATPFFIDFAGISKAKFKKLACLNN